MLKIKKGIPYMSSILFVITLLGIVFTNRHIIPALLANYALEIDNLSVIAEQSENAFVDHFAQKNIFINLNGLMNCILGNNALNLVQKLKNDQLADDTFPYYADKTELANKISIYAKFLDDSGIDFLCIPLPSKLHFYGTEFMPGHEGDGHENENVSQLIELLEQRDVPYIDMDTWFQDNNWSINDAFFRTDHHWKPESAFVAAKLTVDHFVKNGMAEYNENDFSEDKWKVETIPNFFLGTHGKRVGSYYAGVDDFSYIHPVYETEYVVERINSERILETNAEDNVYQLQYLEPPSSYFTGMPYYIYLGGDYPLAYIVNKNAANKKKIIVIGDSFRLPYECFLSTQFSELYHVDMRHYADGTFTELVKEIKPDAVIMIFNGPYDNECLTLGLEEWYESFEGRENQKFVFKQDSIRMDLSLNDNSHQVVYSNIEPGSYELIVGDVLLKHRSDYENIPGNCVQIALVNMQTNKIVKARYLQVDYSDEQKWLFTVPEDTSDYEIIVYDGISNNTLGNSAEINNLCLFELF